MQKLAHQRWAGYLSRGLRLVVVLALTCVDLPAQPRTASAEHEVKAAYLYQFSQYVDWPRGPQENDGSFLICVLGADPFGAALDEIARGKTISGHRVEIKRIVGSDESRGCRILFVSRSEDDRLPAIVKALDGRVVLTVGEGAQFTRRGGMVGFTSEDKKVRFTVNLTAAENARVRLSSRLLRLAAKIEQ